MSEAPEPIDITYVAEHTPAQFHSSNAYVRGLMGPIGSGKSVACCIELMARGMQQAPNRHGIRKFRCAVIRNSYPELKSTTIKTWQEWFPPNVVNINWGAPITGTAKLPAPPTEDFPNGTLLEFEVLFMSLDKPKDVKKVLSMELTMAWINEAREIPYAIVEAVSSRLARYPSKRDGAPITFTGLIMDTNPPDDDHWWYNLAEVEKPSNHAFFRQPGALLKTMDANGMTLYVPNPRAENVGNQQLGYDYWLNLVPGKSEDWIRGYIMGEYATVYDGKPVYPEYNDHLHCATEDIEPMRGMPLMLGFDFGLTPACAIFQISPKGQIRVLDEVVALDMGVRRFVTEVLRPKLNNEYAGMSIRAWGDPAGTQRAQSTEDTCMEILAEEGVPTEPASTQEYVKRRESVAKYLTTYDSDGEPAFLLSPRCRYLRKGFNGAYQYERVQVASEERYKDAPKKNIYSHIHEGLQYGVMETLEGLKIERVSAKPVQRRSSKGWAA